MPILTMDQAQTRALTEALDVAVRELLLEIARTDDREYRRGLQLRHGHLEGLRRRLASVMEAEEEVYV